MSTKKSIILRRSRSTVKTKNSTSKILCDRGEKKLGELAHSLTVPTNACDVRYVIQAHVLGSSRTFAERAMILLTTCADEERSCQRCIKRGIQDVCHDKIKNDASNELMILRDVDSRFQHVTNLFQSSTLNHETVYSISLIEDAYALSFAVFTIYNMYAFSVSSEQSISISLIYSFMISSTYSAQVSLISLHFMPDLNNQTSSMQSMIGVLRQNPQITSNSFENIKSLFVSMTVYTTSNAISEECDDSSIDAQTFLYSFDHNLRK